MAATSTTQQLLQFAAAASPPPPPTTLPPPPCSCRRSLLFHQQQRHDEDDELQQQMVKVMTGRWRSSLSSGLRTALACTIVGLVALYGPPGLRRHITFPAFSHVVTVIIVTDATLGTALRGAISAFHATLMGAAPSVVALWLAHITGAAESVVVTSAVVALTTFTVALPESVGPVAKRIALGQIIIIYVARFQQGEHPSRAFALMHPTNVVACTALGVVAALLAVVVPWPRLATREARDKTRAYKLLAAERVRVMVDASACCCAISSRQRRWKMAACVSEANRLASASNALLHRVNAIKEDLRWEQGAAAAAATTVEMPLTAMQMALQLQLQSQLQGGGGTSSSSCCCCSLLVEENHANMIAMRDQIRLALLLTPNNKHHHHHAAAAGVSCRIIVGAAPAAHNNNKPLCCLQLPQLAPCLFLFSLYQLRAATAGRLLVGNANTKVAPAATSSTAQEEESDLPAQEEQEEELAAHNHDDDYCSSTTTKMKKNKSCGSHNLGCRRRVVAAAKCGFSLGLAVLLGLLFNNDHGFWAGLIVATTISTGRESTWSVAAARAHGTALGSIYGVLGCLLISQQRLLTMDLRFLALLPWMVVSTFLKRSRAYGPAGGVAAALSGVIIMGRRYDEPPMAFTVARLVETFIGISCTVVADMVFQPGARPSVQARDRLTCYIATLAHCLILADDYPSQSQSQSESQLKQQLALLKRHVAEAGSEPTYMWLPPFPVACYNMILSSLGRMVQLLQLYHQARMMFTHHVGDGDTIQIQRRFNTLVSTSLRNCLRMLQPPIISTSSSSSSLDHPHHQEAKEDLEAGNAICCCCEEEEAATTPAEELVAAFLAHALLDDDDDQAAQAEEGDERGLLVCCLASMALCMGEIIKEAHRLEAHIIDLTNLQPRRRTCHGV